ncbi:uncharacterized protein RAG0_04268 [Rhynchosporium agropyri]|uniref:Uncharacterized protein n=1 Tax=Rhynchosporium agropyri TaxID=914238 RepID=A0A1E1K8H6_9HELO|nr:uncharacterized protein RAG0_04268 [Rhynchosporium agropyri]
MNLIILSALYIVGALSAAINGEAIDGTGLESRSGYCSCTLTMYNGNTIVTAVRPGLGVVRIGDAQVFNRIGVRLNKCAISLDRKPDCIDMLSGPTGPTGPNCDSRPFKNISCS